MKMISARTSGHSAVWTLVVIISTTVYHVDSQARVCYFGPPPDPGPNILNSHHWMKQILLEIRQRCPGRVFMLCAAQGQGEATTESANECLNPEPLGLAGGTIPDERFRASNDFASFFASNARLNHEGFWQPSSFENSWIEVDLVNNTLVSGVLTQGSGLGHNWRVTKYKVKYRTLPSNSSAYEYVTYGNGSIQVFSGNIADATTPVTNFFHDSINATVVRLEPIEFYIKIALRFELLICSLNES